MLGRGDNRLPTSFPYETRLNVLHKPLELIDEKSLADACEFQWYNQTLCRVNESVVRLGVVQGEYHWHKHDDDDEFFYVLEVQLLIDLEDKTITLAPRRTVMLMVETNGIVPTGD